MPRGRPKKPEGEKKVTRSPKVEIKRPKKQGNFTGKRGAPARKKFDDNQWKQVEALCKIQCTGEEIASIMGVSYDTLNGIMLRDLKMSFTEYFGEKSSAGRASLRRRQWLTADGGNATMQIWLGKQWLGQTDKVDQRFSGDSENPVAVTEVAFKVVGV